MGGSRTDVVSEQPDGTKLRPFRQEEGVDLKKDEEEEECYLLLV